MEKEARQAISIINARMDLDLTEEQMEFAWDFTSPLISFSSPGTGKSQSTIVGLIMAQTYHGIPGRKINAMSFTRLATSELKVRYNRACSQCDITPTITFNTFHSICYKILREKYPTMRIKEGIEWERDLGVLNTYMEKYGIETDNMFYVRKVLETINTLNASFIYDENAVQLTYKFKQLAMPIEVFQCLRRDWFVFGLTTKVITRGDIPVYALDVLLRNREIQKVYKSMYEIMVVDEFQDMTLINLKILSLISSNLIVIGDMKQQIYLFNGASQEIVEEYKKIYPNARERNLTRSFRCRNEIAEYATSVYYPNDKFTGTFMGIGEGGNVCVMNTRQMDLQNIVEQIKEEQDKAGFTKARDTMFLFRNNFSATPIAEELYRQGVLFRVNRFAKVMDLPIFKELTQYALLALEPNNENYLCKIPKLFPEFGKFNSDNCPLIVAIKKSGKSLLDVPYQYKEQSSINIITSLKRASLAISKGKEAGIVYNILLTLYDNYIIEGKWWKLEFKKEFYFSLAESIVTTKTFEQLVTEEYDKERKIRDCVNTNTGVKCYTIHSAKGLEADDVYIIDAEDELFPSSNIMGKYIDNGCEYEAAKELRNERNLLYVAITRAKDNVYITYRSQLTQLLSSPNENNYSYLDNIFTKVKQPVDNIQTFLELFRLEDKK